MSDSPLDLLKEEMNNDEIYIRVNAIHRIPIVATIIGKDAVRAQLLPYLTTLLGENEEVLFSLAHEFGNLSEFLGGSLSLLIQPLEQLAELEETVVREEAVRSLKIIAEKMSDSEIISTFAPMVLNIAGGAGFSSRISAIGLFSCAYTRSGMFKDKFRQKFLELCNEETPIVRRSVAKQMGDMC
jgi:serine/threonine-protein phosphatase 2A regulatory subunit A